MLLKVTLKFSFYCVVMIFGSCAAKQQQPDELEIQRIRDSLSEARIDSAYAAITSNCDTLMLQQMPQMVDSFLKDPALLQHFFYSTALYTDADKKVEKVIRRLQADCDSNLQKETYRLALLRKQVRPVRRK